MTGTLQEDVLLPARIEGRVDLDVNGRVRWVITLRESAQAAEYLSILPSLSLPYAWLTAAQDPEDIRNGLELNGNGQFTATVTVSFASGEEASLAAQFNWNQPPGARSAAVHYPGVRFPIPRTLMPPSCFPFSLILSVEPSVEVW